MQGFNKQLERPRAWKRSGKPRPVTRSRKAVIAKQLESPVEGAARGPKGTEVLKGPRRQSRKRKTAICKGRGPPGHEAQ